MTRAGVGFGLNHMSAPKFGISDFFDLALGLGVADVEIRNDLPNNAILDGTPPESIRAHAESRGLRIISVNALQRFNEWNEERAAEARDLIAYAGACGARALVLVPVNDGTGRANGERQANLRIALKQLRPMLAGAGLAGLVEPLGFEICSLRLKSEAVDAIRSLGAEDIFALVHDTFHHHLAGESAFFPENTGLVHISGVADRMVGVSEMRDPHRGLIDEYDRLDNIGQIASLLDAGVGVPYSFEPFAEEVHALANPRDAIARSMEFIRSRVTAAAA